jgi:hypothetical protein
MRRLKTLWLRFSIWRLHRQADAALQNVREHQAEVRFHHNAIAAYGRAARLLRSRADALAAEDSTS